MGSLKTKLPLLADGGIGTALLQVKTPELFVVDLMNVLQPDAVKAMHRAFYEAGARLLTTNTFCCDPDSLANTGYSSEELCQTGARLAREVAGKTAKVAGSLGPGWRYPSHDPVDEIALRTSYAERAKGLLLGGVDWLWIETVQDPLQAEIAVAGCQDALSELKRCAHSSPDLADDTRKFNRRPGPEYCAGAPECHACRPAGRQLLRRP